ncbi:MAG: PQQ-dependent sugar dehydrogenase [Pseudomonadota bacterium]
MTWINRLEPAGSKRCAVVLGAAMLTALSSAAFGQTIATDTGDIIVETVASGLEHPWGLDFLPDGSMLVTERAGRIRHVLPDGTVSAPLSGPPQTEAWGQGGMLDIAVAPDFTETGDVYVTYAAIERGRAGTALWRGRFDPAAAQGFSQGEVLFRMDRLTRGTRHFGSRIVFSADGETLWFTIGDRGEPDRSQDPDDHAGSVIRLNRDGSVPADNPFVNGGGRPEIWSIGHRNAQGAALHPETGALWTVSHGARGGDEINIPIAGLNYGWPVISYGRHYSGLRIGVGTEASGLEQPIYYWDPSIAPSGALFYTGEAFPAWHGNLLVGALRDRLLSRLTLDGETVASEERLLMELNERIRDVVQGPDGFVYLLTDSPQGRVLRLRPPAG